MPLTDLEAHLRSAMQTLDRIGTGLASTAGQQLPSRNRDLFSEAVARRNYFANALQLLEVRRQGRVAIDAFRPLMLQPNPVFRVNEVQVDFAVARLMLFQSMVSTNWALYDTIAVGCSRICMTDTAVKNPQKSPSLIDFGRGENMGVRMHEHITASFGWNLALSYELRNWVLHSGETKSEFKLFDSQNPSASGLKIDDDAWDFIVNETRKRFMSPVPSATDLTALKGDAVATFLDACSVVDRLSSLVLSWSVGCLELQLQLLTS